MKNGHKNTLVPDIKTLLHNRSFMIRIIILFILILSLKFIFPLFYGFINSKTGFRPDSYFSLAAITLIIIIPLVTGIALPDARKNETVVNNHDDPDLDRVKYLLQKMIFTSFLSFVLVILAVTLAKPVPTEGWLRTLFAAFLFSTQSSVVFLFETVAADRRNHKFTASWIYSLFVIIVPLGLLLHHPWNYFSFFSPFYWITCSWMVRSPFDGMIYGLIALILTLAAVIALLLRIMRKQNG